MRTAASLSTVPVEATGRGRETEHDRLGWRIIASIWLALYCLGQPPPYIDDLFCTGAAFGLVDGKGFTNPYCPAIASLGSSHFYAYLPLHSYILAGWIELCGRTRTSLAGFQCLAGLVASLAFWRLLRDEKTGVFLPSGIAVCVAIYLGSLGLRPEALALAFFACGALLLKARSLICWAFCSGAIFLADITSPNYGILSPLIFLGAFYAVGCSRQYVARDYVIRGIVMSGILVVVILLFLYLINFQLSEFLVCFNNNRKFTGEGYRGVLFRDCFDGVRSFERVFLRLIPAPLLLVGLAASMVYATGIFRVRFGYFIPVGILLAGSLIYVSVLSSTTGDRLPLFMATMVALFVTSRLVPRYMAWGQTLTCSLGVIFLLSTGHALIQMLSSFFYPVSRPPSALAQEVERLNPAHIYVDEYALDVVYNYHLPVNATDFYFSLPSTFHHFPPTTTMADFPPGSAFVLSTQSALKGGYWMHARLWDTSVPLLRPFFPMFVCNPYGCTFIQATSPSNSPPR